MKKRKPMPTAIDEVALADLGDLRLNKRLQSIVGRMLELPDASIPAQMETEAAREAAYQFLNNPRVSFEKVLAPHAGRTTERIIDAGIALVVHDTTEFHFRGEAHREGLGRLGRGSGEGFFFHGALAVGLGDHRPPLGLLGAETFVRKDELKPKLKNTRKIENRESLRWGRLVDDCEATVRGRARLIHVMDSEADIYELLESLTMKGRGFIIRSRGDRRLVDDNGERQYLTSRLELEVPLAQTTVSLSKRKPRKKLSSTTSRNQPRAARSAILDVRACPVDIHIPDTAMGQGLRRSVPVNIVSVVETEPPEGMEAVNWCLLTSEPIATPDDLRHVIDGYRSRWLIEEYFKAIKSGCAYEKCQLESYEALRVQLAMTLPVAYDLLLARYLSRAAPDTPATKVFSSTMVDLLRHEVGIKKVPVDATVKDALYAIARLGGHITSNGEPGWAVLGRGYEKALLMERGWRAALQ